MKTTYALIFCVSVMLLMYLSGAINKSKPSLVALQNFSLYDKIECTQACADSKVIGEIRKGEQVKVLSQIKGKTKTVLRLESKTAAGWVAYDEALMKKIEDLKEEIED